MTTLKSAQNVFIFIRIGVLKCDERVLTLRSITLEMKFLPGDFFFDDDMYDE